MSVAFPLLCLPDNAQRKVLNNFDVVQLINFSLLSNNAKQFARSLNRTIGQISLCPGDKFIEMLTFFDDRLLVGWTFYPPEPSARIHPVRGTVPIYVPSRVKVEKEMEEIVNYENPKLTISEWLKQFIEVFNHPHTLDFYWTKPHCLFDMKSIKNTVEGFKVDGHTFTQNCSMECAQLALKNMPELELLFFNCPAFRNPAEYQNMLMQNVDSLIFGSFDLDLKISLDEMLLINCKSTEIISRHITDKMINQYLKHWIRGSNPRMENMRILFEPNLIFDEDVILKGLKYHRAEPGRKRDFKIVVEKEVVTVEGGIDIRRKNDGTEATIVFEYLDDSSCFGFYVSH